MMICSQPSPFYEDRPVDHVAMENAIRKGLQHLERSGVDFLAIACNTAHIYYRQLATSVSVPLLNMVESTVSAIPGSVRRVALIAARPTAEAGIYQSGMRGRGLDVIDLDWQSGIDRFLGETRTSSDPAIFARSWDALIHRARSAQADLIVVACLDLSGVIGHATPPMPLLDASRCLAREIVEQWLRLE
jgi:aspartate racemase